MPIGNAVIAGNADIAGNVPAATVRLLEKGSRARSETGKIGLSGRGRKNGADHFAAVPASLALLAFQPGASPDPVADLKKDSYGYEWLHRKTLSL
jgi:hypothetical protein